MSGAGLKKPCLPVSSSQLLDRSLPPKSRPQPVGASKAPKVKEFKTKCRILPGVPEPPGDHLRKGEPKTPRVPGFLLPPHPPNSYKPGFVS